MLETSRAYAKRAIASVLALLLVIPACDKYDRDDDLPELDDEYVSIDQEELDQLVEEGLRHELPPPLSEEELELYEVKLERQQTAEEMALQARAAMAPLAIAAAMFAPSGPVDLLLSVMPVHKLGNAAKTAQRALRLRTKNKRAKQLIELQEQVLAQLDGEARDFLRVAAKLKHSHRVALEQIHSHTQSPNVIRMLMRKQLKHDADVAWIAQRLRDAKLDPVTVRRFTFDGDFVAEFTEYSAGPSWRVLRDVVEGRAVDDGVRRSLAAKLTGLLGEQSAAQMVRHPLFAKRHLGLDAPPIDEVARGMRYERGSFDIVAYGKGDTALFIEVKNWSATTWDRFDKRDQVLQQLDRHTVGAKEKLHEMPGKHDMVKVLMVSQDGFLKMDERSRKIFRDSLRQKEWRLEQIPSAAIRAFGDLIDDLR